jgi:ribonuclease P protein component
MKQTHTSSFKQFGFPKKYRLTKTDEYSSVFDFRKSVRSSSFALNYLTQSNLEATIVQPVQCQRLGLVIGKRYLKRAVDRNLVKRVAREQFRLQRSQLPIADMVVRLTNTSGLKQNGKLARRQIRMEISVLLEKMSHKLNSPL